MSQQNNLPSNDEQTLPINYLEAQDPIVDIDSEETEDEKPKKTMEKRKREKVEEVDTEEKPKKKRRLNNGGSVRDIAPQIYKVHPETGKSAPKSKKKDMKPYKRCTACGCQMQYSVPILGYDQKGRLVPDDRVFLNCEFTCPMNRKHGTVEKPDNIRDENKKEKKDREKESEKREQLIQFVIGDGNEDDDESV